MKPILEPKDPNLKLRKTAKLVDKSDATEEQKYIDNWLEARKNTGNYNDQLGGFEKDRQMTNLYSAKEKEPIDFYRDYITDNSLNLEERYNTARELLDDRLKDGTVAEYDINNNNITVIRDKDKSSSKIHEYTHSLNASKQEKRIAEKIKPKKSGFESYEDYLDHPAEIYSRLMQTRRKHNMDPKKNYSLDEIKKMKNSPFRTDDGLNLIERYSPKELHYLFNRVADNKVKLKSVTTPKYT